MKINHRVFHSFWSKPLLKERFGKAIEKQLKSTLLFTAIGVIALKNLDVEVVLHTDDYGIKLFEILPYNEIYLTLNDHDINEYFWASGKMLSLEQEPLGSCHLDLDAWIKQSECREIIFTSPADLVIQSTEDSDSTYLRVKDYVLSNIKKIDFIDIKKANNFKAYNCGLVKINNQELKDIYLSGYWCMVNELNNSKLKKINDKYFIPDLITEQWLLYQICEQYNFKVETICEGWGCHIPAKIGFTHLLGEKKYDMDDDLRKILINLDEKVYHDVMNTINERICVKEDDGF